MRTETSDFDFELPQELIAQTPLKDRSASRLLVVHKTGNIVRITISVTSGLFPAP